MADFKKNDYNRLSWFLAIAANAISDIEERCNCIDLFCMKIEQNPFDDLTITMRRLIR